MAEYFYDWFGKSSHIVIQSANPDEINDWQDILCILINNYPKLNPSQIYVSNKHDNLAIVVGDNINVKGTVKISFEKLKEVKLLGEVEEVGLKKGKKGVTNNAKSWWEHTIK